MLTEREYWFWLCNINGIGYQKITELLDYYQEVKEIFTAKENTLSQIKSLVKKDIEYLSKVHEEDVVHRLYEKLMKEETKFLLQQDVDYPKPILQVYEPPYAVYVKGKLPDLTKPKLAIVGARNCTNYGRELSMYFARELAKEGVQIISGLAMGVDGYSHQGALIADGYTLGILGCGIDCCYPESNRAIYEQMIEKGGVMSEHGYHVKPRAGNFPKRNRLIAGMSDAILVVEAKERSGSFITVDQGLEQGKDIFVIPGRITDKLSVGCNRLARMGAQVVCHPRDLLEYFHLESEKENQIVGALLQQTKEMLSEEELKMVQYLSLEPVYLGRLVEQMRLDVGRVSSLLISLELKQVVREVAKNYYALKV